MKTDMEVKCLICQWSNHQLNLSSQAKERDCWYKWQQLFFPAGSRFEADRDAQISRRNLRYNQLLNKKGSTSGALAIIWKRAQDSSLWRNCTVYPIRSGNTKEDLEDRATENYIWATMFVLMLYIQPIEQCTNLTCTFFCCCCCCLINILTVAAHWYCLS